VPLDARIWLTKVIPAWLDDLAFADARGPGVDMALQFEAVSQFTRGFS
jgi:hypothetical protein